MAQELELIDVMIGIARAYQEGRISDDDLREIILFLLSVREGELSHHEKTQIH